MQVICRNKRFPVRACGLFLATIASVGCGGGSSGDAINNLPSISALIATCNGLAGQTINGVRVTAAVRYEPVPTVSTAGFCKVSGTRAPYLDMEVDLPDNWSGRYFQQGGGGFNGTIPSAITLNSAGAMTALDPTIATKAAVYAASNGGNRASVPAQAAPRVWASGTPEGAASANDYSYQSLGTTLEFAKGLIDRFYNAGAKYRYFNGCSNGGREAYIVAQRWPSDFDGVVSGCETEDMGTQAAAWLGMAKRAGTPSALSNAQYAAAYAAAVKACDAQDGLTDNYLAKPSACAFDPALLQCGSPAASTDARLCLSGAQVQTLKDILAPTTLANGTVVYSGFDWSDFSTLAQSGGLGGGFALLATGDASWLTAAKQATFNLDADYPVIAAGLRRIGADHDRDAIARFVSSGKKLISWHAAGDNLLSAKDHARNDAMLLAAIKSQGLADPAAGTRFFQVPANNHGLGAALGSVDWASAIMDWVENGSAPTRLTYRFIQTGATTARNLPVCLGPAGPHYKGAGDVNSADSYDCR